MALQESSADPSLTGEQRKYSRIRNNFSMTFQPYRSNTQRLLAYVAFVATATLILILPAPPNSSLPPTKQEAHENVSSGYGNYRLTPADVLQPDDKMSAAIKAAYGNLPLRFEVNVGQTDESVSFISRGPGYALFLSAKGAALSLKPNLVQADESDSAAGKAATQPNSKETAFFIQFKGANRRAIAKGFEEFPGKTNYFIGNDPKLWRRNVATFARVRYEEVYPGIDLVYYGNQKLLEYDFEIQPGANLNNIRLAFDGAADVSLNSRGDLIVETAAGEITQLKPLAFQEINGQKRECTSKYVISANGEVSFSVSGFDDKLPLVIDPILIYSTYLGGIDLDRAFDIAVDSSGNAYITGETASLDFPVAGSIQPAKNPSSDVFVTKLNSTGTGIVYSTFLGGAGSDIGRSIAIDSARKTYVTGQTTSSNFPIANALHSQFAGLTDGFVVALDSTGSALVYSTYLGGSAFDAANAIAVDLIGQAYITGQTTSSDFPTSNALQAHKLGHALFKSANGGSDWNPSDNGMPAPNVAGLVFHPSNPSILYAAAQNGIFKSSDSGTNWMSVHSQEIQPPVNIIAIDPTDPAIVYAVTNTGIFKSTDNATTFSFVTARVGPFASALVIDPITPTTLYASTLLGEIYKSIDSGQNWSLTLRIVAVPIYSLAIDPTTPSTIYAGTGRGVYKSVNSGSTWIAANTGIAFETVKTIIIDNSNPATLYAGGSSGVFKSTDGGNSWNNITGNLGFTVVSALAVDPTNSSIIYLVGSLSSIYKTTDGGVTWNPISNGYPNTVVNALVIHPTAPESLYIATSSGSDVFVAKLAAGGTAKLYSTYLGGVRSESGTGIALDENGNAYLTGFTSSLDFPVANAFQATKNDFFSNDAFVTKINPAGSALVYSTYLGGEATDEGRNIVVKGESAHVVGLTNSSDFPVSNPYRLPPSNFINDAFITKFNASGNALDFSTCLGGAGADQGNAVAVAADGAVFVTGSTGSSDFPTLSALQEMLSGGGDAFITKLNSTGSALLYSTYLGGNSTDEGHSIAVDDSGSAYVTGTTRSANFPVANPFQSTVKGTDGFIIKIASSIDLAVTMTDSPDPVLLGNDLSYDLVVSNHGELPASGVVLTNNLPSGSTLISAQPDQGTCSGTTAVTCDLGTIQRGASTNVRITILPPATRNINNTATVSANEPDPLPANNSASQSTHVVFADLSVNGATAYSKVAPGARINYIFRITNNTGSTVDSVIFNDELPDDVSFYSCTALGGTCGGAGNIRTVSFSGLVVGQSVTIVLVATVNPAVGQGIIFSNTATVTGGIPDSVPTNNSTVTTVEVTSSPLMGKTNGLLAYSTGRIFKAKTDGSEAPVLFPGIASGMSPRWSPDGNKLAFIAGKTSPVYPHDTIFELNIIKADGTDLLTLANNASDTPWNNRGVLSWSPDGTSIAYVGKDKFIYIANVDGSGFSKLPNSPGEVRDLDWSPDGSRFILSKGQGEIYSMNVDGSELTKLVGLAIGFDGPMHYVHPTWSPDMTKILFVQKSNNYSDIFIINADGTGAQKFLNHSRSSAPAWSPDGKRIAFYERVEVHVIDIDGSNDTIITADESCCDTGSISWQPVPTNTPMPAPGPFPSGFSLSGRINADTPRFAFGEIRLTGRITHTISFAGDGYAFIRLPPGEYTVTPVSVTHTFSPLNRTVTITDANISDVDFDATYVPANITGRVTDTEGNPLAGIKITSTGGFPQGSTLTDANGFYSFIDVQRFRNYSIFPDPFTAYAFTPSSAFFSSLQQSQVANFVGTRLPTNVIRGRIVEVSTGRGISGIIVSLSRDSVAAGFTISQSDGSFSFGNQPSNHRYSLFIVFDSIYIFEPRTDPPSLGAQIVIPNLTSDQNLTFRGTLLNSVEFGVTPTIREGDDYVDIPVIRTGEFSSVATVDYFTGDASASQTSDYSVAAGTLRFEPFETIKNIRLLLTDDSYVEATESFVLTLQNPVGAQLGAATVTSLSIIDNDSSPVDSNPIDDPQFFVRQHYLDFLNRIPDQAGLDYWTSQITACNNDSLCIDTRRVGVSAAFFIELEFQETGSFVYSFYKASHGQRPTYAQFMSDRSRVVTGTNLEAGKQAFADSWVQRPEFLAKYPADLTGTQFVDALLQTVQQGSGVDLTSQRAALINDYNQNQSRARILRLVVDNAVFKEAEYNRAFVLMQYFGYLRRDPDEGGYQFWLDVLNNRVPGNFRGMVCAFITSGEYQARFSSVRTRTDTVCGDIP